MKTTANSLTVDKGTRIYDERLRPVLEPAHLGEYVVINVETGEYEVDPDHLAASTRAANRWPDVARYGTRVGSRTAGRIGGRVVQKK